MEFKVVFGDRGSRVKFLSRLFAADRRFGQLCSYKRTIMHHNCGTELAVILLGNLTQPDPQGPTQSGHPTFPRKTK